MSAEEIEAVADLLYHMGPSIDPHITLVERERNLVFGDPHILLAVGQPLRSAPQFQMSDKQQIHPVGRPTGTRFGTIAENVSAALNSLR